MTNDRRVTYSINGKTLEVVTDMIEVTTMVEPDPYWSMTDEEGHDHDAVVDVTGAISYPTLTLATGPATWCEDCRDLHPDTWFECRQCQQKIIPGVTSGTTRYVNGMTSYVLDGEHVPPETAQAFIETWQRQLNDRANDDGGWNDPEAAE